MINDSGSFELSCYNCEHCWLMYDQLSVKCVVNTHEDAVLQEITMSSLHAADCAFNCLEGGAGSGSPA